MGIVSNGKGVVPISIILLAVVATYGLGNVPVLSLRIEQANVDGIDAVFASQSVPSSSSFSSLPPSLQNLYPPSSGNQSFILFNGELEDVNETKIGIPHDVYTLQQMIVKSGDNVTVDFYNTEEDERHTFTIGAPFDINSDLAGGENATINFSPQEPGIYEFYCIYHQPTMRGQLVVLP
jgi:plastocyanin